VSTIARSARGIVLFAVLVGARPLGAQSVTTDTLSFVDLPGVFVVISGVDASVGEHGLHADSLRVVLETKFADAGIRLLTEDEWKVTLGNPMAILDVTITTLSGFNYMYRMQLELRQMTVLSRDSTIPVFVPTWKSDETMGIIPTSRLSTLDEYVRVAADRFIDAFVLANRGRRRQ
jgi:hypothetical protein